MIKEYAIKRLKESLGTKEGETVLVVTDSGKRDIGEQMYLGALEVCKEAGLIIIKPRKVNREEPPGFVAEAMKKVDVILMPTSTSFTHTTARIEASRAGARIASMPGITEKLIRMDYPVDYRELNEDSGKLLAKLKGAKGARVTTALGTNVSFSLAGRSFSGLHEGLFLRKGQYGNLPAGELYSAPLEGTANGRIVVDASMAGVGELDEPIAIDVKDGFAVDILGGKQATEFKRMIFQFGKSERTIAEFGIGTNPYLKITGEVLGDEKVKGTCHFALGDNIGFGGRTKAKVHLDGVLRKPTIYVDGVVLAGGRLDGG